MVTPVGLSDPVERSNLIYRWDLDKTYLRTEFDSIKDLVRAAIEPASRKKTVPGAGALLRELRCTGPAGIYILSGSPEQMRRRLEEKLRLDGIQWDAFTLKPSLQNLLRGRFRFLRDQVSYKLAALMESRIGVDPDTEEVLFGDDAEADAFIYSIYGDIAAGRVGNDQLMSVLRRARVYEDDIPTLVRMAGRVPRRDHVRRIFIHLDRVSNPELFAEFGQRVCPFYNYFQPALVLLEQGAIDAVSALRVGAEVVISHAFGPDALAATFMEIARRRYIGPLAATRILEVMDSDEPPPLATASPAIRAFSDTLRLRLPELQPPLPIDLQPIDYVGLFSRDHARSRAARKRAKWRRGDAF